MVEHDANFLFGQRRRPAPLDSQQKPAKSALPWLRTALCIPVGLRTKDFSRALPSRWRRAVASLLLTTLWIEWACAQNVPLIAPDGPRSAADQKRAFRLPPGFSIELVASEPEIRKPMNLAFDAKGRLFVTQSTEYPWPAEGRPPRDTVRMIVDSNGDGVPDKVQVFADGLNIPIGVSPVPDGLLCHSIPNIWRLIDADGDDVIERREVAYASIGFRDTHGMASSFNWWIDGWIYACHGFANDSLVKGKEGKPLQMNSGNTYRIRPDGSVIEPFSRGQVNPFGMFIDPLGNVFTSDCHTLPLYQVLRGAYYPSFGKPDDGLGFGPTTLEHLHGSTGIAGVVIYHADHFPEPFRKNAFIGNPVTGRINRDVLQQNGSTFRAIEQPDFLTCEDQWFRPVDIKLAPDGSLYVADFYNCMIGHYEVPLKHPRRDRELGRIWRIKYDGAKPKQMGDLSRLSVDELIARLADPNLVVRVHATHQLVHRIGPSGLESVRRQLTTTVRPWQRMHALWVVERLAGLTDQEIKALAIDEDLAVRVHTAKVLAERPSLPERLTAVAYQLLADRDAFVQRAAADALGRHPAPGHIAKLLHLWKTAPSADTHLIHVVRMALRDQLAGIDPIVAKWKPTELDAEARGRLLDVALGWRTDASAKFVLAGLTIQREQTPRLETMVRHVARYLEASRIREQFLPFLATLRGADAGREAQLLRQTNQAFAERGDGLWSAELNDWATNLAEKWLTGKNEGDVRSGLDLARDLRLSKASNSISKLTERTAQFASLRAPAFESLQVLDPVKLSQLAGPRVSDGAESFDIRNRLIQLLGMTNLQESRLALSTALKSAPENLALAIAQALSASREGAEALLAAATEGKCSPRLLQDTVVAGRLAAANIPELDAKLQSLLKDLPPANERMLHEIARRKSAFQSAKVSPESGQQVFAKNCAACHRLAGKGEKIGPELDGIGSRGVDRLLEDILDSSKNVDQLFRSSIVALKDGSVLTGLTLREEGNVLLVADAEGKVRRVNLTDIDQRRLSKLSPMPADFATKIPETDFYHLLAFLLTQRAKP